LVHIQLELSDLIPENVGEGRTLKSKKMSPPHNLVAGTHNSTTANVTRELIQYYFKAHILSLYITKPHKNKMNSEETNESNQKDLSSFHFSLKIDSCPSLLDLSLYLSFFLSNHDYIILSVFPPFKINFIPIHSSHIPLHK